MLRSCIFFLPILFSGSFWCCVLVCKRSNSIVSTGPMAVSWASCSCVGGPVGDLLSPSPFFSAERSVRGDVLFFFIVLSCSLWLVPSYAIHFL